MFRAFSADWSTFAVQSAGIRPLLFRALGGFYEQREGSVRARVADWARKLHLTVPFADRFADWKPEYTALVNEVASLEMQVYWENMHVIPWKE